MSDANTNASTVVLKLGGSVLGSQADLAIAASEIVRFVERGHRVVAVVSAFAGTTDALLAQAGSVCRSPDDEALAMLLATGELTTASLMAMTLAEQGLRPCVLGAHALGLRTKGQGADTDPASIDAFALTRALDQARVAVVPGFVGVGPSRQYALLGRGGSDLTALFIAAQLRARCRLIKDVNGLYERDPALPGPAPRRYRTLSHDEALTLDGQIVQHKAVRFAKAHRQSFEVGALGCDDVSVVGECDIAWHSCDKEVVCAG